MAETEDRAPREAELANPMATEHGLGGVMHDEVGGTPESTGKIGKETGSW